MMIGTGRLVWIEEVVRGKTANEPRQPHLKSLGRKQIFEIGD